MVAGWVWLGYFSITQPDSVKQGPEKLALVTAPPTPWFNHKSKLWAVLSNHLLLIKAGTISAEANAWEGSMDLKA